MCLFIDSSGPTQVNSSKKTNKTPTYFLLNPCWSIKLDRTILKCNDTTVKELLSFPIVFVRSLNINLLSPIPFITLKSGRRLFGKKEPSREIWPLTPARIKCLTTNRHKAATNRQHESRKRRNRVNFLQRPKRSRGRETNEVETRR